MPPPTVALFIQLIVPSSSFRVMRSVFSAGLQLSVLKTYLPALRTGVFVVP